MYGNSAYQKGAFRSFFSVLLGVLLLFPASLAAQGWVEPLRPRPGSWIQRVESRIRVEVRDRVAVVVVDEWFRAHGRELGEADYLYPLPTGAVFSGFSLYQGEEELRGEIMDAARAREIYEEIVRKRRDPALIELVGQGLLRARIFPLAPGEIRRVTLRYEQRLPLAGDALQFRYEAGEPSLTGCPGNGVVEPRPACASETASTAMEVIVSDAYRFLDPFSPTHPIEVRRGEETLSVGIRGALGGPFSLFLPLARPGLGLTLATHKPLGEDGYFLLSLTPGQVDATPEPRDLSIVLDVSGSMSGDKIRQARRALLNLLQSLSEEDRFRIVAFSNAVRPFNLEWAEARPEQLREAETWVQGLNAEGGTNMAAALEEALRLPSPGNRLPVTVFLTDGLPTVGETSVDAITRMVMENRGRMRIFSFGVGHDVNTSLLDRMAEEGRGSTNYVSPGEDVERALSLLAAKIRHPVLTDLFLTGAPGRLSEIYPVQIPDVFAGEELVLFGRYETLGEGPASGALTLEGQRGGRLQRFSLDVEFPDREDGNAFLPRLWASRKLGFLTRRIWTEGETEELKEEIRKTALRYGLPSPYTSYLVTEAMEGDLQRAGIRLPQGRGHAGVPAPTSGAEAVTLARSAKALRDVASMAELREAEEAGEDNGTLSGDNTRPVGGRLFHLLDGVWKDATTKEGTRSITVAPFSGAYFDLLEAIPELRAFAREFQQLEVQGVDLLIRIREDGVHRLSIEALESAREAFLRTGSW